MRKTMTIGLALILVLVTSVAMPMSVSAQGGSNTLIADYNHRVIEVDSGYHIVWEMTGLNYPVDVERLESPPPIEVSMDIKPGSDPNSINLKSKGVIPVAILTTDDFDASTVDAETVCFGSAQPVRYTLEDVDGDGDLDMILHFKTQDVGLEPDAVEATLTGQTLDGENIKGGDSVKITGGSGKGNRKGK